MSTSTWTCISCEDELNTAPILLVQDKVCHECFVASIVPRFHSALKNELEWPVNHGEVVLEPRSFEDFFDNDFLAAWDAVKLERRVAPAERVYCSRPDCSAFLGMKLDIQTAVECGKCKSMTCVQCAGAVSSTADEHKCVEATTTDPFESLVRGRDYQICPRSGCGTRSELIDGCNHVKCSICNLDYCFLCATPATGHSDHWQVGQPCPRYGQPGAANAIHDPAVERETAVRRFQAISRAFQFLHDDPRWRMQADEQLLATWRPRLLVVDDTVEFRLARYYRAEFLRLNEVTMAMLQAEVDDGLPAPAWVRDGRRLMALYSHEFLFLALFGHLVIVEGEPVVNGFWEWWVQEGHHVEFMALVGGLPADARRHFPFLVDLGLLYAALRQEDERETRAAAREMIVRAARRQEEEELRRAENGET